MYSAPYLTLTVGDKGIKCPSESPKQCRKRPLKAPPIATMAFLSAPLATVHRWLHGLPPRAPGEAPRATRWWMHWSVGTEWPPAVASALPRPLSCRVRKLVAHRALICLGFPGKLLLLGPCLEYFVLEWLQRNHGGPWRSPGKPRRGPLQLPMHKFGILGYPYSSTPTVCIQLSCS